MQSQAKTPSSEELFLDTINKLNTSPLMRPEEKTASSDHSTKNVISADMPSVLEKIPAETLSELVEEAAEKNLEDAIDKARKIPNTELDQIIQNLIDKKFSKQLLYHALQKIFDDELRRGVSCLFYQGDEAAIEGRLEFLEEMLIKHFGFAGFITGYFITIIAFEGGSEDYFNALKVLCLCKNMLEKFPEHESLKYMNQYWSSVVKESSFLEMKAEKAYLAGELIDKMLEDYSKKIGFSFNPEINEATPEQLIEKAKKESEKILITLGLQPEKESALEKKATIADIKLLTSLSKKESKAELSPDSPLSPSDMVSVFTFDGSRWTTDMIGGSSSPHSATKPSPSFFERNLNPKSLPKSYSTNDLNKIKDLDRDGLESYKRPYSA